MTAPIFVHPQLCHCSQPYCCRNVCLLIKVTGRKPTHHSLYIVLFLQPTTEDWCKVSSSFAARHLKKVHLHLAGSDINFLESCLSSLSNSYSPQELDVFCGAPGVFSEGVAHIHAHTFSHICTTYHTYHYQSTSTYMQF